MTRTAIILAAGKGARMGDRGRDLQKLAMDVDGSPLLFRLLEILTEAGLTRLIVVVGFRAEDLEPIIHRFDRARRDSAYCSSVVDPTPRGTLTSARHAFRLVTEPRFLIVDGSILASVGFFSELRRHSRKHFEIAGALGVSRLSTEAPTHPVVEINANGRVVTLHDGSARLSADRQVRSGRFIGANWFDRRLFDTPLDAKTISSGINHLVSNSHALGTVWDTGRFRHFACPEDFGSA